MSIIPCVVGEELQEQIKEFVEVLKTETHTLGNHGLSEEEFYRRGLLRGAIESLRGEYSATMREKREFANAVLNHMQDAGFISNWESSGAANRHDYTVTMNDGRIAAIELKGCLDGNNTTIFDRPNNAQEFLIWSICSNPAADPKKNAWSGIHTRLSAEIITNRKQVDGVIVWDMFCGTAARPCPKLHNAPQRLTQISHYSAPPPCIYVLPSTIPTARNNPSPMTPEIGSVGLLNAVHTCFGGRDEEVNYVSFDVQYRGTDTVRRTRVVRGDVLVKESPFTAIRRS